MTAQKMTTKEAVAYLRNNSTLDTDFDKCIRTVCDALEAATAERDALAAQVAAAREQVPEFWYVPALDEDDEDGLLMPTRDGKCPSSYEREGAYPLYAAPVPPSQDARDAERYRYIRDNAKDGAVKTLLPLYRAHYFVSLEPIDECPTFDDAIDAAILAAKVKP